MELKYDSLTSQSSFVLKRVHSLAQSGDRNILYLHRFLHFFLDNDKPGLNTSNNSPVEGSDNVTLTCSSSTSDVVVRYIWYKNNITIPSARNHTYPLPHNTRNDDGHYSCMVLTKNAGNSSISDRVTVKFLCKALYFVVDNGSENLQISNQSSSYSFVRIGPCFLTLYRLVLSPL